ncbi:MAG: hypothetical protein C5B45_04115 [Chlamydiae bacterium]|nr:MAG: hypothetical protein C5B45_04115 [Chlamydiota bacterium]
MEKKLRRLYKICLCIGQDLLSVEININLAATSADQVVLFAKSALQGYRRARMITCLKHFLDMEMLS